MSRHGLVCTIIARNYEAHARVLLESLRRSNPERRLVALVLDDELQKVEIEGDDCEVLSPMQVGLERRELHHMAAIYDVMEMATAIKPWLLRTLLARGHRAVLFLDPDIEVFGSLDHVFEAAERHSLVLTPHLLEPLPRDGLDPRESGLMACGTYNLGFVSVSPEALPFLDWWSERLARDCLFSLSDGLFVDQRWVDQAVHFFPHHDLHDDTTNVAWWNLDSRPVEVSPSGYTVKGKSLCFFHFSSFDPHDPGTMTRYRTRRTFDDSAAVQDLLRQHAARLLDAGYDRVRTIEYGFARSCRGLLLTRPLRRRYRAELLERGPDSNDLPDPFEPADGDAFATWASSVVRDLAVTELRDNLRYRLGRVVGLARAAARPGGDGSVPASWARPRHPTDEPHG